MPAKRPDLAEDRARALALTPVSRETTARLDAFVDLLRHWQGKTNLIAPSTIGHVWTRHIADSLQLLDLTPEARVWVDLGSGGGFPGMVIACALAGESRAAVHLIESNGKKAAFLREAVRVTKAPAIVHATRIDEFFASFAGPVDAVTARALAPLNQLMDQCVRLLITGAVGVFPKGQDVDDELTEASKYWNMKVNLAPSRTDPRGRIVVVKSLERRGSPSH